jgi:DNA-binding MarR family transcriptional regulator
MPPVHLDFFLDLSKAHAIANRRFDAELGGLHGLGLNDLQVLSALEQAPGRRLRRIDLAKQLGVTASGVTWILRPLRKRRLVSSEASVDDARVAFAVLTEAGRRLLADALPSARRLATELLQPHLGKQELEDVADLMARVSGRVRFPATL